MTHPVTITSDRARTTRTGIPARSSASGEAHTNSKSPMGVATLHRKQRRDRVLIGGGRAIRHANSARTVSAVSCRGFPNRDKPVRTFLQSAAVTSGSVIPAVISLGWLIAGARCVLAQHWPFQFVRAVSVARHQYLGFARFKPLQKSPRGIANRLHEFSSLPSDMGNHVRRNGQSAVKE